MKSKLVIASLLLAGACAANLNAQEKTNYYRGRNLNCVS